jgi:hypothetical protein
MKSHRVRDFTQPRNNSCEHIFGHASRHRIMMRFVSTCSLVRQISATVRNSNFRRPVDEEPQAVRYPADNSREGDPRPLPRQLLPWHLFKCQSMSRIARAVECPGVPLSYRNYNARGRPLLYERLCFVKKCASGPTHWDNNCHHGSVSWPQFDRRNRETLARGSLMASVLPPTLIDGQACRLQACAAAILARSAGQHLGARNRMTAPDEQRRGNRVNHTIGPPISGLDLAAKLARTADPYREVTRPVRQGSP